MAGVNANMLLGGKYALDRRLGGGGMAEVFLARIVGKEGFQRPVAIKRILPGYGDQKNFSDMFISEARLSAKLRHPNVVSVLDFDQDNEGRLFLVMELVDGTDLNGLLRTGPLPFDVIAFVIAQVLRGLGHAHNLPFGADGVRGLIHRDVSPHNVLLSWEGEVKVSDFGIAKARAATEATGSLMLKGKPAYMSPEQISGTTLDGTSDLFGVGVMDWEMLTGEHLFAADTVESTIFRVMYSEIIRPSVIRREVPAELERVALRLLERDRRQRFPTAEAAIEALEAWKDFPRNGQAKLARLLAERLPERAPHRVSSVVQTGPDAATITPHSGAGTGTRPARPALLRPTGEARRGRGRAIAIAGAVMLAGAGVAVGVVMNGGRTKAEASSSVTAPMAAPTPAPSTSTSATSPGPASASTTAPSREEPRDTADSAGSGSGSGQPRKRSPEASPDRRRTPPPLHERAPATHKRPGSGIEEIKLGG